MAVDGRVGTMESPSLLNGDFKPAPKACIFYIGRTLAMSDSVLSLYPGSSQSVEEVYPRCGITLLWLHLLWAAHTLLNKQAEESQTEYFCTFRVRDAQALSISMALMFLL